MKEKELTNDEKVAELTREIEGKAAERNALLNAGDLSKDFSLERNVESIAPLFKSKNWHELANTGAMIADLCRRNVKPQKSPEQALREHAKMPAGIKIPWLWGAGHDSYFRFGAPILLSAKSGVGKSAGACNIAVHNFLAKIPTVYFAGEDTLAETVIKCFTIWSMVSGGRSFPFVDVEKWLHETEKGSKDFEGQARLVYTFSDAFKKYVRIVESEYMSPSGIVIEVERAENHLGDRVQCILNDYIQINEAEHYMRRESVREQNMEKSKTFKKYIKGKPMAFISVSQLNDDNRTAESTQFEKDAAQWIILERDRDDKTDELSPELRIRMIKGRRTGSGRFICHFDGPSGAFIKHAGWSPMKKDLYAND